MTNQPNDPENNSEETPSISEQYPKQETPPTHGVPPMRRLAPEMLQPWLHRVINDTFRFFIESPMAILIAALFPLLVDFIIPPSVSQNLVKVKFDENITNPMQLFNDGKLLFIYVVLMIVTTVISYGVMFQWIDRTRRNRGWGVGDILSGFAKTPRIFFALLIQISITFILMLAALPFGVFAAMNSSLTFLLMAALLVLGAFYIVRWQPKFDYFLAGMATTKEPVNILLREWWELPGWLWMRFLALLGIRFFVGFTISILSLIFDYLPNGEVYAPYLQNYITTVAGLVMLAMTAVGFARGRDEWAELTEQTTSESDSSNTREWVL
ncbi:MAG: hypothetical protein OEM52_06565 [bacterium]|nr:hypothetical protein [bacterium]